MKIFRYLAIVVFVFCLAQTSFSQQRINGKVVEVSDGKTIVVELSDNKRVTAKLEYIEVPEPEQQLAQAVRDHLKNLVLGKRVELVVQTIMPTYVVGKIYVGEVNVSQQMLRDGAAWYAILEKHSQNALESQNFQIVEAQAKLEKRGIWGVAQLKPAWEFRAEKAQKERDNAHQQSLQTTQVSVQTTSKKRRYLTPEEQNQVFPKVGMWAEVTGISEKEYLGIKGLYSGSIPSLSLNYTYTAGAFINLTQDKSAQKVEFRALYGYRGNQQAVEKDVFVFAFYSIAGKYRFLNSNSLTVFADKKPITVGKAKRLFKQDETSFHELLVYKLKKSDLEKIIKAQSVKFQIGAFSGEMMSQSQTLLDKLVKTAN